VTAYNYNVDGTVSSVVRGSQTHRFQYDALGRTLTATYPESGTKRFFYDVAPSTPGATCASTTFEGLLVKTYDANGTTACYTYDGMNRVTSVIYSGTNWDGENKYFVYDSATVNSIAMTNALGRIAEAYTAPTASGTKVTDEGFSYTGRGEVSNVLQFSTNSGGYYSTGATYFANGAVATVTGAVIDSPWVYMLDGKGRPNGMGSSGSSTDVVSSVTYNPANQPLIKTLSSAPYTANDTYTYDPNTGRMLTYAFTIGATPVTTTGTYTWNANGTLQGLAVVDGINSANTETCAYGTAGIGFGGQGGYDEFGNLISAVCANSGGTNVWGQAFTYDMYNNVTKSVPTGDTGISWMPGYNAANNRYTLAGTTYDSNGNLLNDTFHTYTWNQDNHPIAITDAGITITYDAFGRMVENYNGSGYVQKLYSPIGDLGTMSGQTILEGRAPLPAGGIAATPGLYKHPDMLGSFPLISNMTAGTYFSDRAFAPYGEVYNNIGSTTDVNFTGDNQDLVAGTFDTPNRELNPNQGRWISPDPAHASWNAYSYTTNPLGETDSSGLAATTIAMTLPGLGGWGSPYTSIQYQDLAIAGDVAQGWDGSATAGQIFGAPAFGPTNGYWVVLPQPHTTDADGTIDVTVTNYWVFGPMAPDVFMASGPANNGNNFSWWGAYAKSLFSWKNFSAGFKPGGCFAQFAEEAFDPAGQIAGQDEAIKATAQSGAYVAATAYAANQGLVVPMRSSVVRGILDLGEVAGEAITLGATIYSEGTALVNEVKSFQSGECQ